MKIFYHSEAKVSRVNIPLLSTLHSGGIFVAVVIFFSSLIVADVEVLEYTITRVAGEYYFLFQVFSIFELLACISVVIYKAFSIREKRELVRAKSAILLLSLTPAMIGALYIIIKMGLGYKTNAVVIMPLTTTLFLFGCVYTLTKDSVLDASILFPFSPSWFQKSNLRYFMMAGANQARVWSILEEIQKDFIIRALKNNDFIISRAAKELGVSSGKLRYRAKTVHQIDIEELKKSNETSARVKAKHFFN